MAVPKPVIPENFDELWKWAKKNNCLEVLEKELHRKMVEDNKKHLSEIVKHIKKFGLK